LLMHGIELCYKCVVLSLCRVGGFLTVQASAAVGVSTCARKTICPRNAYCAICWVVGETWPDAAATAEYRHDERNCGYLLIHDVVPVVIHRGECLCAVSPAASIF
jgi:hypothetical protein